MTQKENYTVMTLDTKVSHYLPFPAFLLDTDVSNTAKILYALLLNRSMLSQKNRRTDDSGRVYAIYPIMSLAENIHKSRKTVMTGISELEQAGLILKHTNHEGKPNLLMLKVPASWKTASSPDSGTQGEKRYPRGSGSDTSPVQFSSRRQYQKRYPNNYEKTQNDITAGTTASCSGNDNEYGKGDEFFWI